MPEGHAETAVAQLTQTVTSETQSPAEKPDESIAGVNSLANLLNQALESQAKGNAIPPLTLADVAGAGSGLEEHQREIVLTPLQQKLVEQGGIDPVTAAGYSDAQASDHLTKTPQTAPKGYATLTLRNAARNDGRLKQYEEEQGQP